MFRTLPLNTGKVFVDTLSNKIHKECEDMRLTSDNHEQVMQLFNTYWQGRIERMNTQIRGEHAQNPVFNANNIMEGLELGNGRYTVDTRIIALPDGAEDAMITFARDMFARGHGLSDSRGQDGERRRLLMQNILHGVPVEDRQAVPTWTPGQRVPADILTPILNGHGGNINMTV